MGTQSFYARGDGSSANNAALNVENKSQQPTVKITFDSGPTGDLTLEYNGGLPDPDTTVIIDGVRYNFTLELTGSLPFDNRKVPDPLEGLQVTVISVVIDGSIERFFFVSDGSGTQALMNQFGNGAIALTDANFAPPPVYVCFCDGTDIATPNGPRKVETLRSGDLVITDTGAAKPILWIAHSILAPSMINNAPELRPIRIRAGAIKHDVPTADLYVSAQHRVVLEGALAELMFGEHRVLVAAKHLVGTVADWVSPDAPVSYYHLLLEDHDLVLSNGLASESFQPSQRAISGMSADAQMSLGAVLDEHVLLKFFRRPNALISLSRFEARSLCSAMFGVQRVSA